jgi:hypothetical protein
MKDWLLVIIFSVVALGSSMRYAYTSSYNTLLNHIYSRCERDGAVVFNDVVVQCIVHRAGATKEML